MNHLSPILLLFVSNCFMTFAWYAHLRFFTTQPLWVVILLSWGIAFFEYCFMVPANRLGFLSGTYSLEQIKIIQEVITLTFFVPFAIFVMKQPISLNFLWAGFCLAGAVYFIFRVN